MRMQLYGVGRLKTGDVSRLLKVLDAGNNPELGIKTCGLSPAKVCIPLKRYLLRESNYDKKKYSFLSIKKQMWQVREGSEDTNKTAD